MRRTQGTARWWVALGVGVAMLSAVSTAQAANKLTMSGCGLGYMLFGKDYPNSRGIQILAVTINSIVVNQLFGITSGTVGCTVDGTIAFNQELEMYAEANLGNLSGDMAKGEGEYVTAFASLLGASEASRPALVKFFQERYEVLFPSTTTSAAEMLNTLSAELAARPELLG